MGCLHRCSSHPFASLQLAQVLPPEQRETLFLVAVEGMSYAEAAQMTGAPVGTVMSRLNRARRSLRAATGGMA